MSTLTQICCIFAFIVWVIGLTWIIMCPIERDRQISHGKFRNLLIVFVAIILLPFAITFLLDKMKIAPEELAYSSDMYQKRQPYPMQEAMEGLSYSVAHRDTAIIYTPKTFKTRQMEAGKYDDPSLLWNVYYQFFSSQNNASTSRGRLIAFALSIFGMIFMTGLLFSLIVGLFQRRTERWQQGQIRYRYGLGRFCVVIGSGEMVVSTIRQLDVRYGRRLQHIVVLTDGDAPKFRSKLVSELPHSLEKKVVLYAGSQTELKEIQTLQCNDADEVFVIGMHPSEPSLHDTQNLRTLHLIAETIQVKEERLCVHVLFNDSCTYSIFQLSELPKEQAQKVEFLPFNIQENWARKVLVEDAKSIVENEEQDKIYEPLDSVHGIGRDDDAYVHLVVAGMTEMGMALAVEAAHIAHYPNFARDHRWRTQITFIDTNIQEKERNFKARYHYLFDSELMCKKHLVAQGEDPNFLDIDWEFVEGNLKDLDFVHQRIELQITEQTRMTIALCYDKEQEVLSTALCLPEQVYERCLQVLAYQPNSDEILRTLAQSDMHIYSKLRPFGMTNLAVDLSHKLIPLSMLVNYAYNRPDDVELKKTMVDNDGKPCDCVRVWWNQLSTSNQWSNIYNSDSIPTKLRSVGLTIAPGVDITLTDEQVDVIAEVEHRRWNMEKLLMQYRPLTEEEQQTCLTGGKLVKIELKKHKMAHLDICSLNKLKEIDEVVISYDVNITRIIPTMIKEHFTPIQDIWNLF